MAHGTSVLAAATEQRVRQSTTVSVQPNERITLAVAVPPGRCTPICTDTSVTFAITEAAATPRRQPREPGQRRDDHRRPADVLRQRRRGLRRLERWSRSASYNAPAAPEVETLTATVSRGAYTVTPSPALPDGTYTAQAEQDSASGAQGLSAKNTFLLKTAAPTITLNSPGAAPLHTSAPTLTGVAAHSTSVRITAYPGDTTNSSPAASTAGNSAADGRFSIKLPSLPDGRYTVIATDGTGGLSHPVTFRIKVHAPALTLTDPLAGGHLSQAAPIFMGAAGAALGDSSQLSLQLFHGSTTKAKSLGTKRVNAANGSWILNWPGRLALGTYTVRASAG